MDFFNYISFLPRIFFHPLKSYTRLLEEFRGGKGANIILYSAGVSIVGNICLSISNKLNGGRGGGSVYLILTDLLIYMLIIGLGYLFSLALIYFILSLMGRKIEPGEFIALFLSSDFLFVITLPVSIILLFFPAVLPLFSGLILIIIFIMSIVLKIRAITLCSSVSNFGSAALFFTPLLYILFSVIIGAVYGVLSVYKLLTY